MLIRIFIRYYKLIILILVPLSIQAEENNHVIFGLNNSVVNRIDNFFLIQPEKINVTWTPKIEGKSKYTFIIPKSAYLISKNYADASDLFYLSEQIDNGLKSHSNKSKNVDIVVSEESSNLTLSQSILSDIDVGFFLKNKKKTSFGVNLNKDVIISKNAISNFGVEQANDEHTIFNAKFVKLSNSEKSEFYGNINHKYKSDHINVGVGNTWFELLNQFDFTIGLQQQDKKVGSELYATFGDKSMKFQVGLDKIKSRSNINMFLNFIVEHNLKKKKLSTNAIITSKNNIFSLNNLTLKSLRKKNLDMLWKKYINFN
jgi:hypothetical protein